MSLTALVILSNSAHAPNLPLLALLLVLAAVAGKLTLTDRLVDFLRRHPHQWIRERRIMQVAGYCGFRGRITDARKRGLRIDNKTWRETGDDGTVYTCSAYMYRPVDLLELAERNLEDVA